MVETAAIAALDLLADLDLLVTRRRKVAARYARARRWRLAVVPQQAADGDQHAWVHWVARFAGVDRDRLAAELARLGVATKPYYALPLHRHDWGAYAERARAATGDRRAGPGGAGVADVVGTVAAAGGAGRGGCAHRPSDHAALTPRRTPAAPAPAALSPAGTHPGGVRRQGAACRGRRAPARRRAGARSPAARVVAARAGCAGWPGRARSPRPVARPTLDHQAGGAYGRGQLHRVEQVQVGGVLADPPDPTPRCSAAPAPRRCGSRRAAPARAPAGESTSTHTAPPGRTQLAQRATARSRVRRRTAASPSRARRPRRRRAGRRPRPGPRRRVKPVPASRRRACAAIAGAGSTPGRPGARPRAAARPTGPTPQPTSTTTAGAVASASAQTSQARSSYARRCGTAKCSSYVGGERVVQRRARPHDVGAAGERPAGPGPPQHVGDVRPRPPGADSARSCCRSRRTPCGRTARAPRGRLRAEDLRERRVAHVRPWRRAPSSRPPRPVEWTISLSCDSAHGRSPLEQIVEVLAHVATARSSAARTAGPPAARSSTCAIAAVELVAVDPGLDARPARPGTGTSGRWRG